MKTFIRRGMVMAAFTLTLTTACGQYARLKGTTSSQVGIGFTDLGILGNYYLIKTYDTRIKGAYGCGAIAGNVADLRYRSFFLDAGASYALMQNKILSFSIPAGLSLVVDKINSFQSDGYTKRFSLNYGVYGGLELEFAAGKRAAFVLCMLQRYYIKDDFGQLRFHAFGAVRITL